MKTSITQFILIAAFILSSTATLAQQSSLGPYAKKQALRLAQTKTGKSLDRLSHLKFSKDAHYCGES